MTMKDRFTYFKMDFEAAYSFARLENNDFFYGVKEGFKYAFKELKESFKRDDYKF